MLTTVINYRIFFKVVRKAKTRRNKRSLNKTLLAALSDNDDEQKTHEAIIEVERRYHVRQRLANKIIIKMQNYSDDKDDDD